MCEAYSRYLLIIGVHLKEELWRKVVGRPDRHASLLALKHHQSQKLFMCENILAIVENIRETCICNVPCTYADSRASSTRRTEVDELHMSSPINKNILRFQVSEKNCCNFRYSRVKHMGEQQLLDRSGNTTNL